MEIFVDTSAFIAIANRSDWHHLKAKEFLNTLTPDTKLHTSNYIIDETVTRIRMIVGHKAALIFGREMLSSQLYTIHYIDKDIEKEAFKIFEKHPDKKLSFTDCTSFALMKKLGINKVFAFDDDFIAAGFEVLPAR